MMRSSAQIHNTLIEYLRHKRELAKEIYQQHPDAKSWEIDPYVDIRRKGWADELIMAFATQQSCPWPQQIVNKPAKQGKSKGLDRFVIALEKNAKPDYGIPAQSKVIVCRAFEAAIQSYFSHRKNGNKDADLPKRFKWLHTIPFDAQSIKRNDDRIALGSGNYKLCFRLPELQGVETEGDAKITRSRTGRFYLHLIRKLPKAANPELTEVAAVDFGQKRAIVIAVQTADGEAETATISGKQICALKRERDRRYREINRARARVYRGQLRQYLSAEEQEKALDNTRYGWQMIAQRRREKIDGKGRCLVELGQASADKPLRKRSKRNYRLLRGSRRAGEYYAIRLRYANHAITRAAVDWAVERKVGKIYIGDLKSLPKGRKKGKKRNKQASRNNIWEMPTQAKYLNEKLQVAGGIGTEVASERLSSQVCPNCGRRHKPRNRNYYCNPRKGGCGWFGDRDGVGSANFLSFVKFGTCGRLMPVHNRTLQIAPAIRQGLAMRSPGSGNAACEPAECAAKGHIASALRGSGIVQYPHVPKTARNALTEGKTQAREGTEMLANAKTSIPTGFDDTCSQSTTTNNRSKRDHNIRSLQSRPQSYTQLSFWDTA